MKRGYRAHSLLLVDQRRPIESRKQNGKTFPIRLHDQKRLPLSTLDRGIHLRIEHRATTGGKPTGKLCNPASTPHRCALACIRDSKPYQPKRPRCVSAAT
jgi:hypothetical protein